MNAPREPPLELERELRAQLKLRVADLVAHLLVVLDRHLGDRARVRRAQALEVREHFGPTAGAVRGALLEQPVEHDAVLERRVHALAVERHDRVRRVADEQDLPGSSTAGTCTVPSTPVGWLA